MTHWRKLCLSIMMLISISVAGQRHNNDTYLLSSDNGDGTYTNPILRADYPDPDIIRVGDDYYMVSSSFACMPGIPVCHSKDLINWKIIGHAYSELNFLPSYSMEKMNTAYGRACWAPTLRYHDGWFYIGVNLKSDRFVMFKSQKPEGPYTMYPYNEELYDPGLFIDDDGKKYVTHGVNDIRITRLKDDGTEIMTPGDKGTIILNAPKEYRLYFEGCHTYKRNGWYYIFNPSQGYNGMQMISRSRSLYGPYETRVLIDDDINYAEAGVHQGGYVDTAEGESWAFTFQDRDYMGRDVMLYPMRWVDDWPVVGLDPDTTKITPELSKRIGRIRPQKGVVTYRKPAVKAESTMTYPQQSDEFEEPLLKPMWEFSHVPIKEKWSLTDRPGHLRIYASPAKGYEWARNSLTQKVAAPMSSGTAKIDVRGLHTGDFTGNGIMGSVMLQQGVRRTAEGLMLEIHQSKHVDDKLILQKPIDNTISSIWLRTEITKQGTVQFSYSLDGKKYDKFGSETASGFWRFLGLRHALCCYTHTEDKDSAFYTTDNLRKAMNGYADIDNFVIESSFRGNHYDAFTTTDFDLYDDKEGMRLFRPDDYMPYQYLGDIENEAWISFFNLHFEHPSTKVNIELKSRLSNAVIEIHEGDNDGPILAVCPIKATGGKWSKQSFKAIIPQGTHKITFTIKDSSKQIKLKNFKFEK